MIFRDIAFVTTEVVAIGRIDVLRMHAAEIYVAPAIGEFFDCRYWHNQGGSFFFGQWIDVERAHAMLATIRSAMERDFVDFSEDRAGAENPKTLAASFSSGMGHRLGERLRRLKARRTANALARAKAAAAELARLLQTALAKPIRRHTGSGSAVAYAAGAEAANRVKLADIGKPGAQ
jgi:hypothetical protein